MWLRLVCCVGATLTLTSSLDAGPTLKDGALEEATGAGGDREGAGEVCASTGTQRWGEGWAA